MWLPKIYSVRADRLADNGNIRQNIEKNIINNIENIVLHLSSADISWLLPDPDWKVCAVLRCAIFPTLFFPRERAILASTLNV